MAPEKKRSSRRSGQGSTGKRQSAAHSGRSGSGKKKKQAANRDVIITVVLVLTAIAVTALLAVLHLRYSHIVGGARTADTVQDGGVYDMSHEDVDDGRPALDVQLLTPNQYSRPQIALNAIDGIVIHYTANPGATAQGNHDYFEKLKDTGETHASSHFIIGLDGEIIQCIPSTEISYASNARNYDTLSIECCHPDETGEFTEATYNSLVELTAWLCRHFGVPADEVIRHYDVTGKNCPKYFVEHEDAWAAFLDDVRAAI